MALEVAPDSCDPDHLPMEFHHTDYLTFHSFRRILSSSHMVSALQ
jgi:hypothetical protein